MSKWETQCYAKPYDCIDISTENDSFFCYPKNKTDIVTKTAFATEIIYEMHMERRRAAADAARH